MSVDTQLGLLFGIPGYGGGGGGYSYLTGEQAARIALSFEDTDAHPLLQALLLDTNAVRADGKTLKDYSTSGTDRPVQPGRYVTFDGVNDVAYNTGLTVPPSTDLTVAVWANIDNALSTRSALVASHVDAVNDWGLTYNNAGWLGFYTRIAGTLVRVARNSADIANTWTHICFTWDVSLSQITLYLNGVLTACPTLDSQVTIGVGTFVGAATTSGGSPTNGSLQSAGIWNTILTPDEIADLADPATSHEIPQLANCQGFWHCQDNSDTTLYDASGNGNNLALSGITAATFLAEAGDAPASSANAVGWSDGGSGIVIPRDESDPTKDILGNALDYTGRVPYDGLLLGAPCVTMDSSNDYIELPSTLDGTTLHSFSCKFYAPTAIDSATSYVDGGVAKWNITGGESHITLGSWTSVLTNEVISIGESLGTNRRTGVVDITIPAGWHDLEIRWNSSESRYDIILDGVVQTVTSGSSSHIPLQTILSDAKVGIGYAAGSYSPFSFADIKFRSDADTITCDVPCSDQYSDYLTNRADPDNPAHLVNHTLASTWSNTQDEFFGSIVNGCDVVPWFNGSNSAVLFSQEWSDLAATWSLSFKFRIDTLSVQQQLIGNNSNAFNAIGVATDGSLRIRLGDTSVGSGYRISSAGVVAVGKWYECAVDWDGATLTATLNGVEVINGSLSSPSFNAGVIRIGSRNSGIEPFYGSLCDLVFDSLLNCVMDDGQVTITDNSGNGDNGTGSNLTWLAIPTQTDGSSTVGRTTPTNDGTGGIPLGVQVEVLRSGGVDSPVAYQQGWDTVTADFAPGDGQETTPNYHGGESDGPFEQFFSFGA